MLYRFEVAFFSLRMLNLLYLFLQIWHVGANFIALKVHLAMSIDLPNESNVHNIERKVDFAEFHFCALQRGNQCLSCGVANAVFTHD